MFQGCYGGSQKHPADLDIVLKRAWQQGLEKIIVTAGCLKDVDEALELASKDGEYLKDLTRNYDIYDLPKAVPLLMMDHL